MTSAAPPSPCPLLLAIGSLGGGGAERQLVDWLKHLDRTRLVPRLDLMNFAGELLDEVPADVPIEACYRPGERRWLRLGRWLSRAWRMCRAVTVLRRHPVDVVFAWSLQSAFELAPAARLMGVPLVIYCVVAPEVDVELAFPRSYHGWRRARWTYQSAAKVLANSTDLRDQVIAAYGLDPDRVVVQGNLRDFARLDRAAQAPAPEWPASGHRLLAAGRLAPQKGFAELLEAFRLLGEGDRNASLVILGQGPDEAALRSLAKELGIADRVRFEGFVANVAAYLHAADLFVLSSRHEGMPNVLIEAMALGTPVVATNCPTGPRELLEDGRWGPLVPVNDPTRLALAMRDVLHDLPAARQRARDAVGTIRAQFDVHGGSRHLEQILVDIARSRR